MKIEADSFLMFVFIIIFGILGYCTFQSSNEFAKEEHHITKNSTMSYRIFVDPDTKVQYLVIRTANNVSVVPRLDNNGNIMVGKIVKE